MSTKRVPLKATDSWHANGASPGPHPHAVEQRKAQDRGIICSVGLAKGCLLAMAMDRSKFVNPPMEVMRDWLAQRDGGLPHFRKAIEVSTREHWERHGDELLSRVAFYNLEEMLRVLLQVVQPRDASVRERVFWHCTQELPRTSCLRMLLEAGIAINLDQDIGFGSGAVTAYVMRLQVNKWLEPSEFQDAVQLLCQYGADINKKDPCGHTALEVLCDRHQWSMVTSLRERLSKRPSRGTPYPSSSADSLDRDLERHVLCLLRNGAHLPNISPELLHLMLRAGGRYSWMLKALIEHGVDPCTLNAEGRPLLAVAVEIGDQDMLEFLLSRCCGDHWNALCGLKEESDRNDGTEKEDSRAKPESSASCNTTWLLSMAANKADDSILRVLHQAGYWSNDSSFLYNAAVTLNREVLQFVIDNGCWTPEEVAEALKLQSAVHLFTELLLSRLIGLPDSIGQASVDKVLSQLQKTTFEEVRTLKAAYLLDTARELFQAATETGIRKSSKASSPVLEPSTRSHFGDHQEEPLREANTTCEFSRLCEQKIRCGEGELNGSHVHARASHASSSARSLLLQSVRSVSGVTACWQELHDRVQEVTAGNRVWSF